jgi:DNA-binding MarR family transcriptional regulator
MAGRKPDEAIAVVEREMMFLARVLEAVQRKRSYPLERAEFIILRRLVEHGPQTVGGLARDLLVDDSTMTRQVAALEEKGLALRSPNPADRRAGVIAASAKGEALMRKTLDLRLARIAAYLGTWSAADRRRFGSLLGRLNAALVASLGP